MTAEEWIAAVEASDPKTLPDRLPYLADWLEERGDDAAWLRRPLQEIQEVRVELVEAGDRLPGIEAASSAGVPIVLRLVRGAEALYETVISPSGEAIDFWVNPLVGPISCLIHSPATATVELRWLGREEFVTVGHAVLVSRLIQAIRC